MSFKNSLPEERELQFLSNPNYMAADIFYLAHPTDEGRGGARPGEHRMAGKRRLQEGGGARARKRVRCAADYCPGRPCF